MSSSRAPRSRQTRARIGLALCVLWLAGFELLPWLHVALHDHLRPHHHDAGGATVFDDDGDIDEHAADHDDDGDVDEQVAHHDEHIAHHRDHDTDDVRLAAALAHGEHSLAHHGVAVPTPAPVLTAPLPVDRRPTYVVARAIAEPPSLSRVRAVARGPPEPLLG
jgi:hypothetical protein